MSGSNRQPPRLARWLLGRALPSDVRDDVAGDLAERFHHESGTHGYPHARRVYRRQVWSFAWHFLVARWRDARQPPHHRAGSPRHRSILVSWLDIKLGLRLLFRHPGLTAVAGLGVAVVITAGIAVAAFDETVSAPLPFEDGDRIVVLENWDTSWNNQEHRILHDFVTWRDELASIGEVGAYRPTRRNLIVGDQVPETVRVIEMTAAGFDVPRIPPLMGRYLVSADERPDAPPVVVIGHAAWQRYLGGDPAVVGRPLQLGATTCTIVGVMPAGFAFPENDRFWIPLRANPSDYARRRGPVVYVFGRLADGVDLGTAQAELDAYGRRMAEAFSETHARLQPRVVPYTRSFFDDLEGFEIPLFRSVVALLLVIVGANVAVLVFARTSTRRTELAVRSALGASRTRLVGQLFAESMLLALVGAAGGLAIARLVLVQVRGVIAQMSASYGVSLPFWMEPGLTLGTVVRDVVVLTVLGAAVIGVVPALQATRRSASLHHVAGGGARLTLGRTYSALMMAQVAFAVMVLPAAASLGWTAVRDALTEPVFAADEFLTGRVTLERDVPPDREVDTFAREQTLRFGQRVAELDLRLRREAGVMDVLRFVGTPGLETRRLVEVEGLPGESRAGAGQVDIGFFETFGIALTTGRTFTAADLPASQPARDADGDGVPEPPAPSSKDNQPVVVNDSFVRDVLQGGGAVGRRVRYARSNEGLPSPWYEIVGVVGDLVIDRPDSGATRARLYHPLDPGDDVTLAVQMRGDAASFATRFREIATSVDPELQLTRVETLEDRLINRTGDTRLAATSAALVATSILALSLAGTWAIAAFTVAERRREIGIRLALGGSPRRVLGAMLLATLARLVTGIGAGLIGVAGLDVATGGELTADAGVGLVLAVAGFTLAAGLLAAVIPSRRAFAIEPTEVLHEP